MHALVVCCSAWAVGDTWLGANTGAMLLATAYVLLAGSYLEWCMILRTRYEVCAAPLTGKIQLIGPCHHPSQPSACVVVKHVSGSTHRVSSALEPHEAPCRETP